MKKVFLFLAIFSISLIANELKTVYSYQNALHKAKKDNKYVLIMMSYSGCPVCDYMKDIVFERAAVLEYLNKHFYVVIKDIEKDHYPQRFSSIDSPTIFFIDPKTEKEVIPKKVGGFRPDTFLSILKVVAKEESSLAKTEDLNASVKPCDKKKEPCKEESKITIN